jgi:hypothetical protein
MRPFRKETRINATKFAGPFVHAGLSDGELVPDTDALFTL